ncbi:hypothetical protein CLV51_103519 [Chitinophaga niastensis]|uniref:Uncharacterized protein n=1 Tax=Chitinophaga niastensis TaxID=536980 RepID=A0A2P8HJZ7_CHINA|nr:hypothetical protein [Chitinophaga niastensis]PSL46538.1 hypothetical protein CLV51_103519 [Chitinophaga niastensis]
MFQNPVLDVVIGLVFIYLLYSLLATIIQEMLATKLAFRSKILEKAIIRMLEDATSATGIRLLGHFRELVSLIGKPNLLKNKEIATWFYVHPLIKYLGEDSYYSKPAYLSAQNFSKVIIDLLAGLERSEGNELQKMNDSIQAGTIYHLPVNPNTDLRNPAIVALRLQLNNKLEKEDRSDMIGINPANVSFLDKDTSLFLKSLWKECGADPDKFRQLLEQWFDDTMDRATGWYKRYTKAILFIVGLIIAISFNVDSISIATKLSHDPKLREELVQSANVYLEQNKQLYTGPTQIPAGQLAAISDDLKKKSDSLMAAANQLYKEDIMDMNKALGLGWRKNAVETFTISGRKFSFGLYSPLHENDSLFVCILGWLLTAMALSMGAGFWFDLLNKFMKLRGTGTKIDSSDTSTPAAGTAPAPAPVAIHVNTQTSEEAVG